ncbi:hypothetical protein FB567DRAFT_468067 [Paraphoma chrysanthemicola]|uniref:Uncharacterized protein n=1 Tax=Paraphoma chrysanthemicola TaxID=798071 RepID=A0A8K0VZI7_9PLEO|nr:hypothetical protein FB567DRAFT_468067 [Paraphoma chrysanthemicola]
MTSWKIAPDPGDDSHVKHTSFLRSRKFFAVDDSGSTKGAKLRQERGFVNAFRDIHANAEDAISLWGKSCDAPSMDFDSVQWLSKHRGTTPSAIFRSPSSLDAVKHSDVWFLLTDGEISANEVTRLAMLAQSEEVLNIPLVFLIVGSRQKTPSLTNISVGISFFASCQDTLILFKETATSRIFVIAGKGCFSPLGGSAMHDDLENWDNLQVFADNFAFLARCKELDIHIASAETRLQSGKGVSLGPRWEALQEGPVRVDLDLLPNSGLLSDDDVFGLLAEETFDTLALAYKTRSRIAELRGFLQKQKIEQISPKLKDVNGAAGLLVELGKASATGNRRKELQEKLRVAHTKNREHYRKTLAELAGSKEAQDLKRRNQLVDAALRSLASVEAAGFSADILSRKSNRARRAEVVNTTMSLEIEKLELDGPSFKGFCLVCCGENEVMSICFKALKSDSLEDNTTDFALNFPLAAGALEKNVNLVSSQNICFQCASLAPQGKSIYNEKLTAVVPTVEYDGSNKKYINDQLYLALTARLATGAAGISQLVMAILLELHRTKTWAGANGEEEQMSSDEQQETVQRCKTFQWMLDQLVQNTWTREDFKETGAWVKFPQALTWAEEDFEKNGLASFVVTYPVAGFSNVLALGISTGDFSPMQVARMKSAKAIHSIASKYLAELQVALQAKNTDSQWKQKYLEVIYQDFNGLLVPRDQGAKSLVTETGIFRERLAACIGTANLPDDATTMPKVQLTLFWLLFTQHGHCTAQTFFTRLRDTEPLSHAVLDPRLTVPATETASILLSIFATQDAQLIDPTAAARHMGLIPFATPYGASVLHCGAEGCNEVFCTVTNPSAITEKTIHAIRNARSKHLIQVFGIKSRFENSQTGLPERVPDTIACPPTSIHTNLHIIIAREWTACTLVQRRAILDAENDGRSRAAQDAFVASVRRRMCSEGRGNIFTEDMDRDTRMLLPSFFLVLRVAMRKDGRMEDEGIEGYEIEWKGNTVGGKVRWELEARNLKSAVPSI